MSKLLKLKQERKAALDQAKAITDLASGEGRDFTSSERTLVDAHLAAAKRLAGEIAELERDPDEVKAAQLEGDEMLRKAILELGAGGDPRAPRGEKGAWSATFIKGLNTNYAGRKEFLPGTGTVGVASPITSVATLSDVGRAETVLQFIPRQPAGVTDAVSYLVEVERTHRAAPVAVGEEKPESTYTLERVDSRIKTIAHLSEPVSRNWLSDAPLLTQYLDGVLREGLTLEVEDQVLNGTGLGENFLGIENTPLVQAQPFVVSMIETARRAITLLENLPCVPNGWCFHPNDWQEIELSPDLLGGYVMGQGGQGLPVDRALRRLWGLPVALSVRATEGTGILGDWSAGSRLWDRESARIDWSEAFLTEGLGDYDIDKTTGFSRNLVQFRAELRALFAVLIPRRFVLVDLEAGS